MKKVLSVCLSFLLVFSLCVNGVSAFDEERVLQSSYDKVLAYYENVSTLNSLDEIIALGNAGIDLSKYILAEDEDKKLYDLEKDFAKGIEEGTLYVSSDLAKHILAAIFLGDNPSDVNGVNLVALLESYVKEDGSVVGCENNAAYTVWVLYALMACDSTLANKVADTLVSYQNSEEDINRGAFVSDYSGYIDMSVDTAGWCLEALTLLDKEKYQTNIDLLLMYLKNKQLKNGGYDNWGVNTDTQSNVVKALLVYDKEAVLNGTYDINKDAEVSDIILQNQVESTGMFLNGSNDLNPNGNAMSTASATLMYSTYFHGSFIMNAKEKYADLQKSNFPMEILVCVGAGIIICGIFLWKGRKKHE